MSRQRNTYSFGVKAHVTQYTGNVDEISAFVKQYLVVDCLIAVTSDVIVVRYTSQHGEVSANLYVGQYVVVTFDSVLGLAEDKFGQFMVVSN